MAVIDRRVRMQTSPEALWARLTDHARMTEWLAADSVELLKEGEQSPGGVGAQRVVRAAGFGLVEDILHVVEGAELDYQLVSGVPGLESHLGQVRLTQHGDEVELHWHIELSFKTLHPSWFIGPLLVWRLAAGLDASLKTLKALVEAAD